MGKNLLIVESPAKAKTIEKYLGKDFTVKSSFGHIRDLIKDSKDKKAIEVLNGYKANYAVSPEKRKVVKELKEWVKKVDEVWLATDEDREGEAISWHLAEVLKLDVHKTKRIVFREITKPALKKAIQSPRTIDLDLVNAQQARRVLDRLVGFELSGLLWKKVKSKLSAGRVQSVAVRLVVEKEREIEEFKPSAFFKVTANFNIPNKNGKPVLVKSKLKQIVGKKGEKTFTLATDAKDFLEQCKDASYKVNNIAVRPTKRSPAAPFTTSTLQQEASRKLYFPVAKTMRVAQRLYEAGHITYMRTDSTNLSETALQNIEQVILNNYGSQYYKLRQYKNKKGAQEAHEAIRPTAVEKQLVSKDSDEQRLYELIWKRTVASQMADAKLEKTTIEIGISTVQDFALEAVGEVLKFDGFLKVYLESKDEEDEEDNADGILPPMKKNQELDLKNMDATERFTRPPFRYTEASLVKKLEELSIGRPSTYAPTISKIMDPTRGYVTKESREGEERIYQVLQLDAASKKITTVAKSEIHSAAKNKLFASDIGKTVTDFLAKYFDDIMDYGFTADIENRLDAIADGKINWGKMLDQVYPDFHSKVEKTTEEAERATGERILGKHPESGYSVLVRISRYGPVAQIGTPEELGDEKPTYANLKRAQSIETITLEEALELFKFPKHLGNYKEKEVTINIGRFGPYVKYDEKYVSIPKGEDYNYLTLARAVELIDAKLKEDQPIGYYEEKPITKGKGRFGPFVKWNGLFCSITKGSGFQLETITEVQAIELVKAKIEKEANRYIHQWPDHKLAVENGRWGPFIRLGRKSYKLLDKEGNKIPKEEAINVTLEQVIALVEDQGGVVKRPKSKKKTSKKKATTKKN